MATAAGKKRASPGAEEQKSLFQVDNSEETDKKLESIGNDILRIEIANGQFLLFGTCPLCPCRPWQQRIIHLLFLKNFVLRIEPSLMHLILQTARATSAFCRCT